MSIFLYFRSKRKNDIITKEKDIKMIGYDIDTWVLRTAENNAFKAGVYDYIDFQKRDVKDFSSSKKYGFIITNPPYGERLGEKNEITELYREFGKIMSTFSNWEYNILTSYEDFEKVFGIKSSKNRKLYNGKLKCYYYQYFNNDKIKNAGSTVIQEIIRNS